MKWVAETTTPRALRFVIEPEIFTDSQGNFPEEHFKIWIYENDKQIYDYLQGSLEIAKRFSLREF